MRAFFASLKPSFLSLILLTLLLGIVYPLFIFGIGQLFFHKKANGTLFYYQNGKVLGSEWIAQNFSKSEYFHPRPSSAGANGYDASNASGSNLGPTSRKLRDTIAQNVADYRSQNGMATNAPVPADAITASASGLDPHISPENAQLQSARVARVRNLAPENVRALIVQHTDNANFGLLGDPGVNVLEINLALDALAPAPNTVALP